MRILSLLMMLAMVVAVSSCGPRNENTNANGAYTPNDYCMRVQGQDPQCQNQYGYNNNPYMRNYPMQNGMYNYNQGCGNNWNNMYGNQGLGCYNQGAIGGNPYRMNVGNVSTSMTCSPNNGYGGGYVPQCPTGTYCRPIDAYTGICSY